MSKTCVCCSEEIKKTNDSGFCVSCKSDKSMTITTTNAKKIYGLTDEDLEDDLLHSFSVNNRGSTGTKYIITEIVKLANEICANTENPKKKKKISEKLKLNKKTTEVDKFIKDKIINSTSVSIIKIRKEYIDSDVKSFKNTCNELSKEDKEITRINKSVELFKNNLSELVNDKFTKIKYYEKYCGISNEVITKYENYNTDFTELIFNLEHSKEYTDFRNSDNTYFTSKGAIEKTDIFSKLNGIAKKYIMDNVDKLERKNNLIEKLMAKELILRSDSKLCSWYIAGGLEEVNKFSEVKFDSIDEIVDVMEEMNFYHIKTNYSTINKDMLRKYSEYVYDDDSDSDDSYDNYKYDYHREYRQHGHYEYIKPINEINLLAKKAVLKQISNDLIQSAPKNVVKLYNFIKNNSANEKPKKVNKKKHIKNGDKNT